MEGKTCCVTGHRDLPQKEIGRVKAALRREIDSAVADGFTRFMSGFADGVDQYFAEIVLEKKKTNPALELIAVIPYQKRLDSLMTKGRTYEMLEACADVCAPDEKGTAGNTRRVNLGQKQDKSWTKPDMKKWRYRLLYGIINVQPRRPVTNSVGLTENYR